MVQGCVWRERRRPNSLIGDMHVEDIWEVDAGGDATSPEAPLLLFTIGGNKVRVVEDCTMWAVAVHHTVACMRTCSPAPAAGSACRCLRTLHIPAK